jgi:ribosomal protein L37AE/L43A
VSHRLDCPHCQALASVDRPSRGWWVLHGASWLYAFGSVLGASLTGPLIVGLLPPLFAGGACLITASYAKASEAPRCTECGKTVVGARARAVEPGYVGARQHA